MKKYEKSCAKYRRKSFLKVGKKLIFIVQERATPVLANGKPILGSVATAFIQWERRSLFPIHGNYKL